MLSECPVITHSRSVSNLFGNIYSPQRLRHLSFFDSPMRLRAQYDFLCIAMSCMISLNLRDSATDLGNSKHPSHKAWFKSLAILRDLLKGVDAPIGGRSYCCVDQGDPKQVFYLWRESVWLYTFVTSISNCDQL